jgi:hypothetical protein
LTSSCSGGFRRARRVPHGAPKISAPPRTVPGENRSTMRDTDKPSNGLEPLTRSLPWASRGLVRAVARRHTCHFMPLLVREAVLPRSGFDRRAPMAPNGGTQGARGGPPSPPSGGVRADAWPAPARGRRTTGRAADDDLCAVA